MVEQDPTKEASDAVAHGERQNEKKVASGIQEERPQRWEWQ